MEADKEGGGLTKALLRQKFENFVKMIGMVGMGERLKAEKANGIQRFHNFPNICAISQHMILTT
jgi:hypothetical protein